MQKTFALLKLRLSQGYRMLDSVGWLLVFIFLFTIIGVGLQFLQTLVNLQAFMSLVLSFLLLIFLDYARPDKSFLSSIFQSYLSLVSYLWVEYVLILLPIIFYQYWIGNYFVGFGLVLVAILVAALSPLHLRSEFTHVKRMIKWIPIHNFEIRFFAEKLGVLTFVFIILGFLSFIHIGVFVVWIVLFCLTMPEVFRWHESREMVHYRANFVWKKVQSYMLTVVKLVLIPSLIVMILFPEMWYFSIYLIICLFTTIFLSISFKYAMFTTVFDSSAASNVVLLLLLLMFLPGGVLITLIYAIIQYIKAEKNMKLLYA
jgi:hypothetical protein